MFLMFQKGGSASICFYYNVPIVPNVPLFLNTLRGLAFGLYKRVPLTLCNFPKPTKNHGTLGTLELYCNFNHLQTPPLELYKSHLELYCNFNNLAWNFTNNSPCHNTPDTTIHHHTF